MQNGRCRLHGGLSTGPKTAEGIERIQRAVTQLMALRVLLIEIGLVCFWQLGLAHFGGLIWPTPWEVKV